MSLGAERVRPGEDIMTTPDVEDASPSPEYSGDPDGDDMTEQKRELASEDASPSQNTTTGDKPASNAKDPLRPRRKKARRACLACQRAHLTCGQYQSLILLGLSSLFFLQNLS